VLMWGLFVGAAAAVLAPVGPGALVPLKLAIASADSVGNDVYVAVVVDFGNGSSMTTVSKCVPVASNAKDSDALAAVVGSSNVAYAGSGLLCAIDNYPANGVQNCGQSVGNGDYDFWSYWHGSSGQWSYASNGPTEQSVSNPADDIEGWKFQNDEPASSSDPPPGVAPSYAQICNASTEVPPAQTPSAPVTPTTVASPSAAPSSTPTTARASAGSGAVTPTTSPVSTRSKSGVPTSSPTTTAGAASGTATTTTITRTSVSGRSSGSGGGSHGSTDARRIADASATAHESSGGSSSDVLPGVLVGVVVVALATFALVRWRRRPAEE
jgi:hypothetical protein